MENTYTAQLSSSSGSFSSPVPIGTTVSDANSGTISATIALGTATGTGYRIRVISSNPAVTGTDNGTNLTINLPTVSISPTTTQNISVGVNGTTLTVTESAAPAATSRVWATSTTSGGPYSNTSSTGTTYIPNFATQGTYYVVCKSTFPCGIVTSNEVIVNVSSTVTTGTITGSPFCAGSNVSVPFTSAGTFDSGNTYTAQLSGSTGSFSSPTTIGTLASNANSGTISAIIPVGTTTGTGYIIRVIASNPATTGSNSSAITVNAGPTTTGVTICQYTASAAMTSSTTCPSGGTYNTSQLNAGTGADLSGVGSTAWTTPENITSTGTPYATLNLPSNGTTHYLYGSNYGFAIPSGAAINGIIVYINKGVGASTNSIADNVVSLVKGGTVTGSNLKSAASWPSNSIGLSTYGSTSNLWGATWTADDINSSGFGVVISAVSSSGSTRTLNVDYMQISVNYTSNGVMNWYTASSGGTFLGSGSSLDPVDISGSGITDTNTPGNFTFYAVCSTSGTGCRTATSYVITAAPDAPTITPVGSLSICTTSSGTATLQSSATSGNQWYRNGTIMSGENNQTLTTALIGDYTVTTTSGCTSLASAPVSVVSDVPAMGMASAATSTCFNASSDQISSLTYSSTTNSPTTYSISWNSSPSNSFVNINDATLPASSPISITVPANTAIGTYTGTITVKNADNCVSVPANFTLTVNAYPVATFSYAAASYCKSNPSNPSPTFSDGGVAGTFTSTPGGIVFIDVHTGQINLASCTAGNYTVTNTVISNGCTTTYDYPVEILPVPIA